MIWSYRVDLRAMAKLAELIRLVANKDHAAFKTIYKTHSRYLYRITLRITCHSAYAADAMQDVFLQLWHNAGRFDASYGNCGFRRRRPPFPI